CDAGPTTKVCARLPVVCGIPWKYIFEESAVRAPLVAWKMLRCGIELRHRLVRSGNPSDPPGAHPASVTETVDCAQALPCSTRVNATLSRRYTGNANSGACTWPALNSRNANSAT